MDKVILLILLLQSASRIVTAGKTKICVVSSTDAKNNSCANIKQCLNEAYITIEEMQHQESLQEVEIYFCSAAYSINNDYNMQFIGKQSVLIQGAITRSLINCHNSSTGLYFKDVSEVEIKNVMFFQCGVTQMVESLNYIITTTLLITSSFKIDIINIEICKCHGTGTVLVNNCNDVNITNARFDSNLHIAKPRSEVNSPYGILIYSTRNASANYFIHNCVFTSNGERTGNSCEKHSEVINLVGNGGGMAIDLRACTHNIKILIRNCEFISNSALNAGALGISLKDSVHDVSVIVEESRFNNNRAVHLGGAVVAELVPDTETMVKNKIEFISCNFTGNMACEGGGVYLYAAPNYFHYSDNRFEMKDCHWTENSAMYGTAVQVSSYSSKKFFKDGNFLTPIFEDCTFIGNICKQLYTTPENASYVEIHYGRGAFYSSTLHVKFQGKIVFERNNQSALYLFSSIVEIANNSCVLFKQNSGYQGGAISMIGPSSVFINDNVRITFDSNSASYRGGAIYHGALTDRSQSPIAKCFIKYAGDYTKDVSERNISLLFINNSILGAKVRGQSIFLFSRAPCRQIYKRNSSSFQSTLEEIANFTFQGSNDIGTVALKFSITGEVPTTFIPGKQTDLYISLVDENGFNISQPVYRASIVSENNSINTVYSIISNNKITLTGPTGAKGILRLAILDQLGVSLVGSITLAQCPPGYIYLERKKECECSVNTETLYVGIQRCNVTLFQANLVEGFWAGYSGDSFTEKTFRTSNWPLGHCMVTNKSEIILPNVSSILSEIICAENRVGVVCGSCKQNTSVLYHTQNTFDCVSDSERCHFGILLFIVTEITPVTILFVMVILLDIQLTTGALNGLLLYMQLFATLHITANNFINFPTVTKHLATTLFFIVQMFNLKFFSHPNMSFCLFKGAHSLHLLIFDYVTIFYSLLLILLTVILMSPRFSTIHKYLQKLKPGRKFILSRSIIHGLSGFLVMCYARSTTLSLHLLTPVWLYGKGSKRNETVVFYNGNMKYFQEKHLMYAIPALFALVFMTILPPLALLVYPLCYRVLALIRLEESQFTKLLCKVAPLEKFRPFFDSIQSPFKDEYRYFAGLYFIYRFSARF